MANTKENYDDRITVRYKSNDIKTLKSKADEMNINLGTYVRYISLKNSNNE